MAAELVAFPGVKGGMNCGGLDGYFAYEGAAACRQPERYELRKRPEMQVIEMLLENRKLIES